MIIVATIRVDCPDNKDADAIYENLKSKTALIPNAKLEAKAIRVFGEEVEGETY